jgi:5S rRNA maturation endonuclease (ribonuclease M5)
MWNVELAAATRRVGRSDRNTMLSGGRDTERQHLSWRSLLLDFDRSGVQLKAMLNLYFSNSMNS